MAKRKKKGHETHAVEIIGRWPGRKEDLIGENSHGSESPILRVTRRNYVYAFVVSPKITEVTDCQVLRRHTGSLRRGYQM